MSDTSRTFAGSRGEIVVHRWPHPSPRCLVLLAHGYGEHLGRYEHVAEVLHGAGAEVVGPDHLGHGRSAGERVRVDSFDDVLADLHTVEQRARASHPGLPVVLIGHSMGGLIAAAYAQQYGDGLAALVLSGPVLHDWAPVALAEAETIPDEPLDTSTLSRDPAVGRRYAADPLVWHGPYQRPTLRALRAALDAVDAGPRLTPPTLWLHGGDDRLVPIANTRVGIERIRGADFAEKVYPGARHEIFNETNRDEVLGDVTAFLAEKVPTTEA